MKSILITGGAGFVGSSLGILIKEKYPACKVTALDNLKRRGSELNVARLQESGINFLHGDVRNPEDLQGIDEFECMIECSAEPSVLSGVHSSPAYVINTNLTGTVNCLELARRYDAIVIFLSTSRVYPINRIEQVRLYETETRLEADARQVLPGVSASGISESFPLDGYRSFYGATKLASELLIHEYHHFYGLKNVINRCGVIAGPWQMGKVDQGFVALWMARHFWKRSLTYTGFGGKGKQVRDILHIRDLFPLIDLQIQNIDRFNNTIFNVGGGRDVSVSLCEMTEWCREITGHTIQIDSQPITHRADVPWYISDCSNINAVCNWKPEIPVKQIVSDVYNWLKENEKELKSILDIQA